MIIKGLSNLSIIKKAFIYLLVTCILPTMILGVIAVNKTNDVFKLEINKFSNDLMLSKQKNIELIMQNIESLILNISSLDDIHNTLINENNDSYNKLSAQVKIGYILSGYSNLKGLVSIDVFSMSDMHYHFGDTLNVENIKSDLKQTLFKEAIHSDKVVVWNGIEDNVNVNSAYSKVITASKVIKVLDSNTMIEKPIGFLLVNYDVNAFTENISDSNLKDTQQFIIDNKNRIVFCSDKNQTGSEISPLFIKKLNEKSGNFADKINGEKMIVNYTRSSKSGWIVLSLIPSKVLKAKMSTISNNIIFIIFIFFCMLLIFTFIMSWKYMSPIKKITELFKQLQNGSIDLDTRLEEVSNDEVGELVTWFNVSLNSLKEKKAVEDSLIKSKEMYSSVVNNVKEVIFQTDVLGNFTFLNPAWTEITGFSLEESIGTVFLDYIHPDDREYNNALFKSLIERKKDYYRHTIRYFSKDGEFRWIEVYAYCTLDNNGNVIGSSGTLMDVTENKCMEQELIDREKLLESIAEATNVLLESTEYINAFTIALEILGKKTNADRVYIFENHIDPNTGNLLASQRFEWCKNGIKLQINNPQLQSASYNDPCLMRWHDILSSGKVVTGRIKDFPVIEQETLGAQGIKTILVVPVFIYGKFWGFIGFDNCSNERLWSRAEEETLKIAAASIGGAVKRLRAEEMLQKELKKDFRKTVQHLQNLVFRIKYKEKSKPVFTLFEGKIANELNLNTEEVLGKTLNELFSKDFSDLIESYYKKAFCGETVGFECELFNRSFYTVLSPVIEEGEVLEVVGSAIDITELKKAEERIRYMAYHDMLTGVPNRSFFNECLNSAIYQAQQNKSMVAVMFLDLDQFKLVNDTLGHIAGDMLLKEVSVRLQSCLCNHDTISRMGGDEFTLMFQNISYVEDISKIADKVLETFKQPFIINSHQCFITTSIGITVYPRDGEGINNLLKNADMAMYRAKEHGRNNYQYYTSSMNDKAMERLSMEKYLRKAIDQDEFYLNYQPKFDIKTGNLVGCEALIRWQHPVFGIIPPGDFIPLAEEMGLIIEIGELVLKKACIQAKVWHNQGYSQLNISVNISARQFQEQNIVRTVENILRETGLESSSLELEITENSIMQNTNRTLVVISELKALGIKISIDDFGTGFSSLAYLKRFAVDKLKIDKSFISDINTSPPDAAITASIINMAHSLDLSVVAEGVETKEQLDLLRMYNCDEVQGYLLSNPLNAENFEKCLCNHTKKIFF